MKTDLSERAPVACSLAGGAFKERLAWIAALNAASLRDHRRDGLRLELSYAPEARDRVRELVRREQECCAFLRFELHEDQDAVRVIVSAPEAARDAAAMPFEPFRSKEASRTGTSCCAGAAS